MHVALSALYGFAAGLWASIGQPCRAAFLSLNLSLIHFSVCPYISLQRRASFLPTTTTWPSPALVHANLAVTMLRHKPKRPSPQELYRERLRREEEERDAFLPPGLINHGNTCFMNSTLQGVRVYSTGIAPRAFSHRPLTAISPADSDTAFTLSRQFRGSLARARVPRRAPLSATHQRSW